MALILQSVEFIDAGERDNVTGFYCSSVSSGERQAHRPSGQIIKCTERK